MLVGVETSVFQLGEQTANLCFLMVSRDVFAISILPKQHLMSLSEWNLKHKFLTKTFIVTQEFLVP